MVLDVSKMQLGSRPIASGSGGPRAMLAYYSAIWQISITDYGAFSVPIVIDSPNQQAQDEVNLPLVLKFVATDLPQEVQLIVGMEKDPEYDFDKVIELKEKWHLLRSDEEHSVRQELDPLMEKMFSNLMDGQNQLF